MTTRIERLADEYADKSEDVNLSRQEVFAAGYRLALADMKEMAVPKEWWRDATWESISAAVAKELENG